MSWQAEVIGISYMLLGLNTVCDETRLHWVSHLLWSLSTEKHVKAQVYFTGALEAKFVELRPSSEH